MVKVRKDHKFTLDKGLQLAQTLEPLPRRSWLGLGLLVGLLLLFGLAWSPLPTLAQATPGPEKTSSASGANGKISGKIVNGTTGAALPSALNTQTVKLEKWTQTASGSDENSASNLSSEQEVTADAYGNFVFQNLNVGDKYSYFVSTRYAGVTYYAQKELKLGETQPTQTTDLKIYEATGDRSSISVLGTSVVVSQVDVQSGQVLVLEMYSIQNKADRTFVGQNATKLSPQNISPAVNEGVRPSTLRFFLPIGATGMRAEAGINPDELVETADGLELTTPLLPGENQLVFSYRLAYQSETLSFNKQFAYATPSFRFFTPFEGPRAKSDQLQASQPMQMGQQQLATLTGQNFKANDQLQITLSNLPLPPSRGTIAVRDTLLKVGLGLAILVGLAFLGVYSRKQRKSSSLLVGAAVNGKPPHDQKGHSEISKTQMLERERQRLINKLALLDNSFYRGEFSEEEEEYQGTRARWKTRLAQIWSMETRQAISVEPSQSPLASANGKPNNQDLEKIDFLVEKGQQG